MVADGRLSAASAALISESIAEPTEENLKKLLEKHPSQASPEDIPLPDAVAPIWIPKSVVYKNVFFSKRICCQSNRFKSKPHPEHSTDS